MNPNEPTPCYLDQAHLNRWHEQPDRLRELIDAFLVTTGPLLEALAQAHQQHNEQEFGEILHALLGATKSVGATAMSVRCQDMAEGQEPMPARVRLDALADCFQQTQSALNAFLQELPHATAAPTRPHARRETLLVVEDNPTVRQWLHMALVDAFQVLEAENGEAALTLCGGDVRPAAALVDLNLGRSTAHRPSGLEVIQRLHTTMPVIVLTVDRSPDSMHAAIRAGAWAYLIKPPDRDTLYATVSAVLARSHDARRTEAPEVISLATGLLMAMHHLDATEARRRMIALASAQRRKVSEIAEDLLTAHRLHLRLAQGCPPAMDASEAPAA